MSALEPLITRLEQFNANPFCRAARSDSELQTYWRRETEALVALVVRAARSSQRRRPPKIETLRSLRGQIETDHRFADGPMLIACLDAAADVIGFLTTDGERALDACLQKGSMDRHEKEPRIEPGL